ncbi:MAG: hypothetical protein KGH89_07790 [Thaumarchaeota archaeon]|nr:hypothetical protein [Nitrososphaerota archaeon]MDE1867730.1 hypothetical protein [Nitrososphaerota archaeon]
MKTISVVALISILPFIFFTNNANAYVENIQLQDQSGNMVAVGLDNPSITAIEQGWVYGSVQTSNTQVVQNTGMSDFVSQIKPTPLGSEVDFAGKLDSTATIRLVDNSGQSWSLILEPQVGKKTSQDASSGSMPSVTDVPYYVYGIVGLIGVGTILLIRRRKREIGEISRV